MRTLNAVSVQTIQLLSQLRSLRTPGTWTALPRQCGNRAGSGRAAPVGGRFHLMQMGAASRNSSAGPGTSPWVCMAPTGPGLFFWLPPRPPSSPSTHCQPHRPPAREHGEGAPCAGAPGCACPVPCRERGAAEPASCARRAALAAVPACLRLQLRPGAGSGGNFP